MSDAGINPDTRPYQPVVLPREAISNIAVQTELTRPLSPQTIRMGSSEGKGNSTRLEEMPEANLRGEIIGNPLSQRQVEILFLAGKGLSNERIANELGVSKHTVKNIISETLSKMGVVTAIDAISKGIELGVFPPGRIRGGI